MSDQFKVYHLKAAGDPNLEIPSNYWHLCTCLRSIVITDAEGRPDSLKNHDFMMGELAYEFLLQVICGLDSPLLGETEVLGQFKEFAKKYDSEFSTSIKEILQKLNRDAKMIRSQYLQNLGCTSYGSLLRKELRGKKQPLTILGAGSLAQDILPWFAKADNDVFVYTRNPLKYTELSEKQNNLIMRNYTQTSDQKPEGVLVIAAPLTKEQIQKMWELSQFSKVYDLRGNSHQDTLECENVVTLESLFANIELNKKQASRTKEKAISAIKKQAGDLSLVERPRPFGWEDLWTYS